MKLSIELHKEHLKNRRYTLKLRIKTIVREIKRLDLAIKEYLFLKKQIEQAELRGKDEFDPDRFLKSKKKFVEDDVKY